MKVPEPSVPAFEASQTKKKMRIEDQEVALQRQLLEFKPEELLLASPWSTLEERARKGGQAKCIQLMRFGFDHCQTLAMKVIQFSFNMYILFYPQSFPHYVIYFSYIKVVVSADSSRWSFNIGTILNNNWNNILFHFNPRKDKKKKKCQLIENNKIQNKWGPIEAIKIDESLLFDRTFDLVLQVIE